MASPPLTTQIPQPCKTPAIPTNPNLNRHPLPKLPTKGSHVSLKNTPHPFDETPVRNVVSFTSSITRLCRQGLLSEAAKVFANMLTADIEPNYITFVILLSGCAAYPSHAFRFGWSIHGHLHKLGLDEDNVILETAIIGMYAKCGHMSLARNVFDRMGLKNSVSWNTMIDGYLRNGNVSAAVSLFQSIPQRDKVTWTALIGGFVKNGRFEDALECFREMQLEEVEPDYVTIIAVLTACANLGALGQGLWTHRYLLQQDFAKNTRLNNSIIDMYSRCGCIEFAREVFHGMSSRSLVSWNSIIVGFAVNGHANDALEYFSAMQEAGFKPNSVSFTGVLTACSHGGLVDEGLRYYENMRTVYDIAPTIEHYGCVVDLLSRAGRLEDALHVIENMPMKPNDVVLGSLLAACRTHADVGLAEKLMGHIVELDLDANSNYVLLSNIYAAVGRWEGAGMVRKTMKEMGIRKRPGFSAIEIDSSVHEFVAGDKSHFQSGDIHAMLELLSLELKPYGYVPETDQGASSEYDLI